MAGSFLSQKPLTGLHCTVTKLVLFPKFDKFFFPEELALLSRCELIPIISSAQLSIRTEWETYRQGLKILWVFRELYLETVVKGMEEKYQSSASYDCGNCRLAGSNADSHCSGQRSIDASSGNGVFAIGYRITNGR